MHDKTRRNKAMQCKALDKTRQSKAMQGSDDMTRKDKTKPSNAVQGIRQNKIRHDKTRQCNTV